MVEFHYMFRGLSKYKLVYGHLWATFGASWCLRASFLLQIVARVCRLIFLPIALSLIISRLSTRDFTGAGHAVLLFAGVSLALGIITPLIKYLGMLGENKTYNVMTGAYLEAY